jgi:hypothetical protein
VVDEGLYGSDGGGGVVVDGGFGQVELPASALTDGEYQGCIVSLRASLAFY